MKTIAINSVTRIEGHARITVKGSSHQPSLGCHQPMKQLESEPRLIGETIMLLIRGLIIFALSLFTVGCGSSKKTSTINENQLKSILSQLSKDQKARISYSTLEVQYHGEMVEGLKLDGDYEIFNFDSSEEYRFEIFIVGTELPIQIYKERLNKNKGTLLIEKQFTEYVKTQMAKVSLIRIRLNIVKILDEDSDHVQQLCQVTSKEIELI
jgi:hypothetical protein